ESRRRHTRLVSDWSSDVCSSDLVERDLDLRDAARRRRNADQIELAEELVVHSHLALALEDADGHRRLVVGGGREDLALAGRDGRSEERRVGKEGRWRGWADEGRE